MSFFIDSPVNCRYIVNLGVIYMVNKLLIIRRLLLDVSDNGSGPRLVKILVK